MTESLAFTGERFTPECVREIWYEHWHRYVFASRLAGGKQVLDAACGEGYGSNLLARYAADVVGVDVSVAAVEHAQARYAERGNLRFQQGDATALPFEAGSFDLVVSFETLEHLLSQEELLAGFARVLRPDGLLIISSPDRRTYSDQRGYQNEHHLRELYRDEFEALLARHFSAHQLFGQKLMFDSAIWSLDGGAPRRASFVTADAQATAVEPGIGLEPLYFIAIAAKQVDAMPTALDGSVDLFTDAAESVYAHYNHEVRKNMSAGGRIAELEAQCEQLQTRCSELQAQAAAAGATAAVPSRWRRFWSGGR